MKKLKLSKNSTIAALTVASMIGLSFPTVTLAATTPSLGTAATYGVLSSTFTRNVGVTAIVGDLGYTTLSGSGTNTVSGSTATPATAQSGTDQATVLSALSLQPCTFTFAAGPIDLASDITHGPVGVYTPGVYCSTGAMDIGGGGTITLTGTGTYIFRPVGALNSTANSIVALSGASACDVFWTPTQATTLGANSTFIGTIIDDAGITVGSNVSWIGRALAFGGTVTTDTANITVPVCSTTAAVATGERSYAPPPLINVTKVPSPLNLISGPGAVTYTYTVTNVGQVELRSVWVKDDKCAPVNYVSGDRGVDGILDMDGKWIFTCTKTVSQTETNTATAHGYANGWDGYDTAIATVAVSTSTVATPPLIHLLKKPSVFTLPASGGNVTYSYEVTNPGTEPLNNVTISDDKCTGLPTRVAGHPGDLNGNNLLESNEKWQFTCVSNLTKTTTNIGTATGHANGFTAVDFSPATVVVAAPSLPKTGFGSEDKSILWNVIVPVSLIALSFTLFFMRRKGTI